MKLERFCGHHRVFDNHIYKENSQLKCISLKLRVLTYIEGVSNF